MRLALITILVGSVALGQSSRPPPAIYAPPVPTDQTEKQQPVGQVPRIFPISVSVTAPPAIEKVLESAVLLELRKRPDVLVTTASGNPQYRWQVVCVIASSTLAGSSLGLQSLHLDRVEKYYKGIENYGFWWIIRSSEEHGGTVVHHPVFTGPDSDLDRLASRL